ncbi:MAG: sensor histidine kinase [Candidatus Dormibacteria bacterium]
MSAVRSFAAVRGHLVWPAVAVLGPAALTAVLVAANLGNSRDYAFVYLGVVAVLGLASGLPESLLAAGVSFLLVDFFFVRPVHTFQFADTPDLINLAVFFGTAGIVGTFGSRRRAAQLRAERLARELQEANTELARLAARERLFRDLEETERLRRQVLANVSHELRTPLAGILTGATSLLRRRSLPDDVRPEIGSLATEARRLNRLVSDLLDMTRIEGGIVDLRPAEVDVVEAAEASISRLHSRNGDRRVSIDAPSPAPEVIADWQRLAQVFDNLLDNANRLSPPAGQICVRVSPVSEGRVVIRVLDEGPGVPAELRQHIFERFVRGALSGAKGDGGMGLGLPIVRGLVEAQGGRVWLQETPPGAGACFAFSLPAAERDWSIPSDERR